MALPGYPGRSHNPVDKINGSFIIRIEKEIFSCQQKVG
jgi:hypothetical protein